jgi:hypothetical protein
MYVFPLKAACNSNTQGRRLDASIRPAVPIMLLSNAMVSRITVSVAVALALFTAAVRVPAGATCIITNTSSEKACEPGCCANKSCCATSHERTGPPVQPLAKSSSDQQNVTAISAAVVFVLPVQVATKSRILSSAECKAHSPPPLALSCICLI